MRFSVYFDSIVNEKMKKQLFSYRNIDVSCTHARGHAPSRKNVQFVASWRIFFITFCIKIVFFKVIDIDVSINAFKRLYLCLDRLMIYDIR